MSPTILILILALLASIWWLVRKRRETVADTASPGLPGTSTSAKFHAVSIKYAGRACAAAKNLSGRRFLATAAPKLPLSDCDILDCNCRFVHHEDRRAHKDRRSPFGPGGMGGATGAYDTEQRDGDDRRKSDD